MNRSVLLFAAALAGCNPAPEPGAEPEASLAVEKPAAPVAVTTDAARRQPHIRAVIDCVVAQIEASSRRPSQQKVFSA